MQTKCQRSPQLARVVHPRCPVLRVTQVTCTASLVTLKVEGRIAAEWVEVLERECVRWLETGRQVRLDFAEVSAVDHAGVAMLRRFPARLVKIVNAAPFISALLAQP